MPRKSKPKKRHKTSSIPEESPLFRRKTKTITAWTKFAELSPAEQDDTIRKWRSGELSDRDFDALFASDIDPLKSVQVWDAKKWIGNYRRAARAHLKVRGHTARSWRHLPFSRPEEVEPTVWSARNILIDADSAEAAVRDGEADLACSLTFRMAGDFMLMTFIPVEDSVKRGRKALQRAKNWGKSRWIPEARKQAIREIATRIWSEKPSWGALRIGEELETDFKVSKHTIRKLIGDLRPRPARPAPKRRKKKSVRR